MFLPSSDENLYQQNGTTETGFAMVIISHDDPLITCTIESLTRMHGVESVELIIVLDASEQAYCEHVLSLVRPLMMAVQVIRTTERASKGALRNLGAKKARCEWVAFIDSDCLIQADYAVNAMQLLGTAPVINGLVKFLPGSSWFSKQNCRYHDLELRSARHAHTPNLLVNRDLFIRLGGFSFVPFGEDYDLGMTFLLAGYPAVKANALVITHHDNPNWRVTVRKRFGYGLGWAYRVQRRRAMGERGLRIRDLLPTPGRVPGLEWDQYLYHFLCIAIYDLGLLYGRWYWRKTLIPALPFKPEIPSLQESTHFLRERMAITGIPGTGKSTLARTLASTSGFQHIEVDGLRYGQDWQEVSEEEILASVRRGITAERWIFDGNMLAAREVAWSQANLVVWLDYALPIVMWRLLKRNIRRIVFRKEMENGNREHLGFLLKLLPRTFTAIPGFHREQRTRYEHELSALQAANHDLQVLRFKSPRETKRWLADVLKGASEGNRK